MVVFGQSVYLRANWFYTGKWFYSDKSGCIRVKKVVIGQKWLCSSKGCCIRAKEFVFPQSGCYRAKVVVLV